MGAFGLFSPQVTSYLVWGLTVLLLGGLYLLQQRKVNFGIRVLVGMVLGLALGNIFGKYAASVGLLGTIYVNLIKMLVMPLVGASIITSLTSLTDTNQLKKIGIKTISLFLGTTAVAALIGVVVGLVFDPGAGINAAKPANFTAREIPTFDKVILDLFPTNPIADAAAGKVVPVIFFAVLVAVAILQISAKKPEVVKPLKDAIKAFSDVMFAVTKNVIKLTPYGVLGLMATMGAKYGLSTLLPLGKVIVALYVAVLIHFVVTYGGLVSFVAKVNPLRFFKKAFPTISVAFTTRSSYATLPVNLEVITKRMKVSERVASFVAPLGATINMNGCGGIWPAIVAIFVARAYNLPLGPAQYGLIILTATIASIGVAGVPGPASISTTVVLTALGLPLEGMGILLGIDAVVDMARTAANATGTTVSSLLVGIWEKEFDRTAFNDDRDDEEISAA